MAWPSSIPSFTALTALPAASLNLFRDAFNVLGGAADTYTPTWSATTTPPTLGATIVTGRFRLAGKWADIHISITVGAGFAAGSGNYTFSLPPGCAPLNAGLSEVLGSAVLRDVSVPTAYPFTAYYNSPTAFALVARDGAGSQQICGAAAPFVPAVGDRITIQISAMEIV